MAEKNQVQQEMKNQQLVATKDPKKVEAGKRLATHNRKKREKQKAQSEVNQYYSIGVVLAVGAIGGLGYYIYQTKKTQQPSHTQPNNSSKQLSPNTNKFEMD